MLEGLERLLEEEVRRAGFILYDWELKRGGRRTLQVFLHADGGVGLDDCAAVSRRLGAAIEEAEAIEGSYVKTGTHIYTITDLSILWLKLDVYESELSWIELGKSMLRLP